ncbi:MAG: hypothetical protein O6927_09320 [Gammaproteobacteria bacterium]|nr:hypothetical protein [Gammaproteobacteria bacterium]
MIKLNIFSTPGLLLILCTIVLSSKLTADEHNPVELGLVKKGAFLLSPEPDTLRDNLLVHSLTGYLPIGTRVVIEGEKTVTNLTSSDDEKYYFVKSELGISGLLREDLLVHAKGRRLAISIASYLIPVHQPNATLEKPTKRFKIGRYGGDYFEVTGETEAGFYDVILHRANYQSTGLPATEKVRLKKLYVKNKQVSFLDPADAELLTEFNKSWNTVVDINDNYFTDVLNIVKENMGEDNLANIRALLGDINNLQCLVEAEADGEFGFKVFSNGFSIKIAAAMKQAGTKYLFDMKKLSLNNNTKYYSSISAIKCEGLKPVRLQQFTMQEGVLSTEKRFEISLSDLEQSKSKWINTLQGREVSTKMVRISGWEQYSQLIKELNEYAKSGTGYLSTLSEETRLVLLNYIVSRISHFEHRDLVIDQDAG